MVRTRVREIRETGRNTMGVKLMDLRNGEKLQAIAPVVSQVEEEDVQSAQPPAEKSWVRPNCRHRPVAGYSSSAVQCEDSLKGAVPVTDAAASGFDNQ